MGVEFLAMILVVVYGRCCSTYSFRCHDVFLMSISPDSVKRIYALFAFGCLDWTGLLAELVLIVIA